MHNLKKKTKTLYRLTRTACDKIDCGGKCCDDLFCEEAEKIAKELGKTYEKPNHNGIRFLSKDKGCILPPHVRPVCSGFICPEAFKLLDEKEISKKKLEFFKALRDVYRKYKIKTMSEEKIEEMKRIERAKGFIK